ncbi:TPA: N-acetyltransferase, partial [Klebsiella pneumoniae]|nr:N-acetyltransferase [Klebsiella pneumoniae]
MDDFYSREITLADMPFLMHEFEEGARLGHFTNEIITPVGSSILAVDQIQQQKFTVC